MWDGSVQGKKNQMFEWKSLYGLPSDLKDGSKFVELLSINIL